MPNGERKLKSGQIFHYFRKHIGRHELYRIFGTKNSRTIDLYCQDTHCTNREEGAFDPIKGVRDMLTTLDDYGHTGVVKAAVAYITSGTGIYCGYRDEITELRATIHEEILRDYEAVSNFQKAIEARLFLEEVALYKEKAIAEIERTYAKYLEVNR